jgi:hypothetical protein
VSLFKSASLNNILRLICTRACSLCRSLMALTQCPLPHCFVRESQYTLLWGNWSPTQVTWQKIKPSSHVITHISQTSLSTTTSAQTHTRTHTTICVHTHNCTHNCMYINIQTQAQKWLSSELEALVTLQFSLLQRWEQR